MAQDLQFGTSTSTKLTGRLPFHVLAKPIGPICNLDCSYCFYLEKESLYPDTDSFRMRPEVLEAYVRQYIEGQPEGTREVNFAWQGGEPTLMGIPFFEQVLELQRRYARSGMQVTNALQTNGVLLDDEWGRFLNGNGFLIGLSIDGPEEIHDRHRYDKGGHGTWAQVMKGLDVLRRHKVEFNTLTVLHRENSDDPVATYDFLKDIGSSFLQFIPIVEHDAMLEAKRHQRSLGGTEPCGETGIGVRSVLPEQFGSFMCGVFDRWLHQGDVGRVFVQHFDMMLGLVMGRPASMCVHAECCGRALALEHNGDLYSCDHYVSPEHRIGNIMKSDAQNLVGGSQQTAFGEAKRDTLPAYCRSCEYLRYCWGACPERSDCCDAGRRARAGVSLRRIQDVLRTHPSGSAPHGGCFAAGWTGPGITTGWTSCRPEGSAGTTPAHAAPGLSTSAVVSKSRAPEPPVHRFFCRRPSSWRILPVPACNLYPYSTLFAHMSPDAAPNGEIGLRLRESKTGTCHPAAWKRFPGL